MRETGPLSTTRPAYITASWSHILATMPRLWVMKISARPCARCKSRSRLRYCAWIVRSRLVVGSSAINRRGSQEMPIAPTIRCRLPQHAHDRQGQCALAGAGLADDAERLAGMDAQRHVVNRADNPSALRGDVMRREVLNIEQRSARLSHTWHTVDLHPQSWRSCG